MALRRKPAVVGTPLDREELEELLQRLDSRIDDLKNAVYEMDKAAAKAARVASDLDKALARAEAQGRGRLSRGH